MSPFSDNCCAVSVSKKSICSFPSIWNWLKVVMDASARENIWKVSPISNLCIKALVVLILSASIKELLSVYCCFYYKAELKKRI